MLRRRTVEQRGATGAFKLTQHVLAGRRKLCRVHALRSEDDAVAGVSELCGEFDGVIGRADDEDIVVGADIGLADVDPVAVRQLHCGRPGRVTVAVGNQHSAGAVAESICLDDEMFPDDIDRGGRLAVADVKFVRTDHVGERHAGVALQNANTLQTRATSKDGS